MNGQSQVPFRSGYVAIIGRPNVGKSTLINAILGERLAIVTPKPQTTRHRITGIFNDDDAQIVFLDTPGYHLSSKPLNRAMIEVVGGVIDDADVVCMVVEPASAEPDIDRELFERAGRERSIVVVNKADTLRRDRFAGTAQAIHDGWGASEVMLISALTGDGVPELIASVKRRLPEGPAYFPRDEYTDLNLRFLAAEIIREKVFMRMHEEIPYSAAVRIDAFEEPGNESALTRIAATIVVERDSQKAMVIGRRGAQIKEIGQAARMALEELTGGRVFLELTVRVEKNWTKDGRLLKELGYKLQ